jgi:hypothetical protein
MTVKTQLQNFLNELKNKCDTLVDIDTTINDQFCESQITISLGYGWSGRYEGGYWGDCRIDDDKLEITFSVGDIYNDGDFNIGEGIVSLTYSADNDGMAYTSQLDKEIGGKLADCTNGMLTCSGSEQGMQDESYLSVDVGRYSDMIQDQIVVQGSFA